MPSRAFRVEESDVRVDLVRPTLRSVSGRIVVQNGPIPYGWLGFETTSSYETAHINPDGTFRTQLQPARHKVELAGMPGGYSLSSVRMGNQDLSQGVVVGSSDVTGLVITVSPPANLPKLRGKVTGVPAASLASAKVELTGHIIGTLEAPLKQDGSFEFPAVTPGWYRVRVPQVAAVPQSIVVIGWEDTDVQIGPAGGTLIDIFTGDGLLRGCSGRRTRRAPLVCEARDSVSARPTSLLRPSRRACRRARPSGTRDAPSSLRSRATGCPVTFDTSGKCGAGFVFISSTDANSARTKLTNSPRRFALPRTSVEEVQAEEFTIGLVVLEDDGILAETIDGVLSIWLPHRDRIGSPIDHGRRQLPARNVHDRHVALRQLDAGQHTNQ